MCPRLFSKLNLKNRPPLRLPRSRPPYRLKIHGLRLQGIVVGGVGGGRGGGLEEGIVGALHEGRFVGEASRRTCQDDRVSRVAPKMGSLAVNERFSLNQVPYNFVK